MNVFMDTEFTNFIDTSLISLGLAAESGEEEYIEVCFDVKECSDFVRVAVMPQLGLDPNAYCPRPDLRRRILTWLNIVRPAGQDIVIAFDYQTDWDIFVDALDNTVPAWCIGKNVASNLQSLLLREHFEKTNQQEHHALHDARANRHAFRYPVR